MTKNLDTTADATGATACECSKYEAMISEQHTEENLASGNYDVFSTGCAATTKREFAPGHDAKLKSFLIEHGAQGHEIRYGALVSTAEDFAKRYTFGYMILEGIEKAKAKLAAKAEREAARAAKKAAPKKSAERKLAESAGVVKVADIVAAEEQAHAEAEAKKVAEREASADWDDAPKAAPILEDEAAMNANAREERERDLVDVKIGRWTYKGHVGEDGVFVYRNKAGELKQAAEGTYKLV
ncbi:hypothetical protein SEA_KEANU_103 [Streptomyces phage Keanu]|nr:hypothetical protein SEA_KEANU_103 [Streptomyces phage Keanu]